MRIFPKGNDRSWTRAFYYAINRVFRRVEWEHRAELQAATKRMFQDAFRTGTGHMRIGPWR